MMFHLDNSQVNKVLPLIRACYPDFNGKTVKVSVTDTLMRLVSHWDSGSRDYFAFVSLASLEVKHVPQNGTMFDRIPTPIEAPKPGVAIIEKSIHRGGKDNITIYIHPEDAKTMALEPAKELPLNWQIVLTSYGLKNTYAGRTNIREDEAVRETGISRADYQSAKAELEAQGAFNKAGVLTAHGKNLRETMGFKQLHHFS